MYKPTISRTQSIRFSPTGIYAVLQAFSIDVAAGALLSGLMGAGVLGVEMPPVWYWALPVAVWLIYTLDHLIDALKLKGNAISFRHQIHQKFFYAILIVWITLAAGSGAFVLIHFPEEGLRFGGFMLLAVLLHLLLVYFFGSKSSPFFLKEFGVAGIYSVGVLGYPLLLAEQIPFAVQLLFGQFFILSAINLLIFSMYDHHIDRIQGQGSFVRQIGLRKSEILVNILFVLLFSTGVVVAAGSVSIRVLAAEGVILLMSLALLLVHKSPHSFSVNDRYRLLGDAAFLFPGIYQFISLL